MQAEISAGNENARLMTEASMESPASRKPVRGTWRSPRVVAFVVAALFAASTTSAHLLPFGDGIHLYDFGLDAQDDAYFGYALASGDFNCDGLDDLAMGLPHWNLGEIRDAGLVAIQYATPDGLHGGASEWLHQDIGGIPGVPEPYDEFGAALASGDFNGNGCDDLAIGLPGQDADGNASGMVIVVYGDSGGGLDPTEAEYFQQGVAGMSGGLEPGDHFGASLAAGDFDGDGYDDLAVGSPDEGFTGSDDTDYPNAGCVDVLFGASGGGLSTVGKQWFHQGNNGLSGLQEGERFGASLAFGNVWPYGRGEELVIGSPGRDVNGEMGAGMVTVLFEDGSPAPEQITQDSPGIVGIAEAGDNFGWSMAIGDFDGDFGSEIAASAPNEDAGSPVVADVGMVIVMELGPESRGWLRSDITNLGLDDVTGSNFGWALASGDFDDDGLDDLAIGAPFGAVYGRAYALYGYEGSLLSSWGAQEFDVCGACPASSSFGYALANGHFDGHPGAGLAIGSPFKDGGYTDLGGIVVHYSDTLFRTGFD